MRCMALAAAERSAPYLEATAACAQSSAYGCWQHRTAVAASSVSSVAVDKSGTYSWMWGLKYCAL